MRSAHDPRPSRLFSALRSQVALVGCLALTGCAAVHRPPTTISALLADADTARRSERSLRDSVIARLARRAVASADHSVDVLMLSGGGQNGAFGVGFIRGWRARTDRPMPSFDLITGISTGALQAPFVFLGTPAAIDTLTTLYRQAADRIAPSLDWFFWLHRTGGLVNTARYDASLQSALNDSLRSTLLAQCSTDRQVVFGTTDLDLGTGRSWELCATLQGGDGLSRTQRLLKAATAIPGIFPQVVHEGHVHSDGGIINNIFPLLTLDDYRTLVSRVRAAGVTAPVTVRLWVIVNGWMHPTPVVMNPASRKQINGRWSTVMFYAQQPQVIDGLQSMTAAATAAIPGLTMHMQWTSLPSEIALDPAANTLFNKVWMQRLETLGTTRAQSASPWDSTTSAYARPAAALP